MGTPISMAILLLASLTGLSATDTFITDLHMHGAVSTKPDDLVCYGVKLNSSAHQYILKYVPRATSKIAHHMMIYGCKNPGVVSDQPWKCGGPDLGEPGVCSGGGFSMEKRLIYAWALDAPAKTLPPGVGLRVGGDTDIQYLILQLHYKMVFPAGVQDDSGVELTMTYKRQPKQLGFYVLGSWGYIPPHRRAFHMESACYWTRNATIYPFGYRTHAHNLGRVISGYRIQNGTWLELGRMSPQQPEMFYNMTHPGIAISNGDILAARCTMNSQTRSTITNIGATNHDEMCNFYMMYSTEEQKNLIDEYCFKDAQTFHWRNYFAEIPVDASSLKGVKLVEPSYEPKDHYYMKRQET